MTAHDAEELDTRGRWLRAALAAVTAALAWAPAAFADTEACKQRQTLAADVDALHETVRRAPDRADDLQALLAQVARLEERHKSLAPVGQECPIELWVGPLQQRLSEVRQAIRHAQRLRAVLEEVAKPAQPWEPDKFRGVPWGASREETWNLLSAAGEPCRATPTNSCGLYQATIGPVRDVTIVFEFGDANVFERALVVFPAEQYATLRSIFVDRYGRPTTTKEETLQNRLGATFTNEILQWVGTRVVIEVRRYGSNLDSGYAVVALKSVVDRDRKEAEKARKKGKDDL